MDIVASFDAMLDEDYTDENVANPTFNTNGVNFFLFNETLDISKLNGKKIRNISPASKYIFDIVDQNLLDDKIASIESDPYVNTSEYPLMNTKTKKVCTNQEMAFLRYISSLSVSDNNERFDFSFIRTCIDEQGCDVNCMDIYGQNAMHEIAREWHTDIALFLYSKGVNIDQADHYGRTPLFVAVASNHLEMIKWLLNHGANVNAKTCSGEEQYPIHYAAKYNTVEALKLLMSYGASPHVFDKKARTPLHVAAEQGREEVAEFLIRHGLPAGTYTSSIVLTLQTLIEKTPNTVVKLALQQFCQYHKSTRTEKYYLSNLELKRGRRIIKKRNGVPDDAEILSSRAKTPLETIVEQGNMELVSHPVITQLLQTKREQFGRRYALLNIILNILHTTILSVAVVLNINPNVKDATYYIVLILAGLVFLFSVFFTIKLYIEYHVEHVYQKKYEEWKNKMVNSELPFCHPQWKAEKLFLQTEINRLHRKTGFWHDAWNCIEAFTLSLTFVYALLTLLFAVFPTNAKIGNVRKYYSIPCLLAIWLRLNRSLMFLESLGPFINVLGKTFTATIQFGFLFLEFFVPMVCGVWVTFGGVRENSDGGEYETFGDTLYQLFLLTIVGDYDYDTLKKINKFYSQLFISLYFILVSIVGINLYVALLSEKFASVRAVAEASAYLNEAKIYLQIEKIFPHVKKHFEDYLQKYGAPLTVQKRRLNLKDSSGNELINSIHLRIKESTRDIKQALADSLEIKTAVEDVQEKMFTFDEKYSQVTTEFPRKIAEMKETSESFLPGRLRKPMKEKLQQLREATTNLPSPFEALMDSLSERTEGRKWYLDSERFFMK